MRRSRIAGSGRTGSPAPRSAPINAAIIAGNLPHERTLRLRQFWQELSRRARGAPNAARTGRRGSGDCARPGGIRARPTPPPARAEARYLAAGELRELIEASVDFDRVNSGAVRLVLGAVNLVTGAETFFDNDRHVLGPDHVLASTALPGPAAGHDRPPALWRQRGLGCGARRRPAGRHAVLCDRRLRSGAGRAAAPAARRARSRRCAATTICAG